MTVPTITTRGDSTPDTTPATQRRIWIIVIAGAAVATVLVAALAVIFLGRLGDNVPHTVTAPVGNTTEASLDLVSGATSVSVRSGDLGGELYRISTPRDAGQIPQVSAHDGPAYSVSLQSTQDGPSGTVEILLSDRVTWQLRLAGGANDVRVDLRGGPVARIDLASGIAVAQLWLPRPRGTATVVETGGVNNLTIHAPANVPLRLAVDGGAGTADIDGTTRTGVSGGTTFTPPGWNDAADRYDVRLVGGVSTVIVDRS